MTDFNKVEFLEFRGIDCYPKEIFFNVSSNNRVTTVQQKLVLSKGISSTWMAKMQFNVFPEKDTPTEAAHKLADWMIRLGTVIKEHEDFDTVDFKTL